MVADLKGFFSISFLGAFFSGETLFFLLVEGATDVADFASFAIDLERDFGATEADLLNLASFSAALRSAF